MTYAGQSLADGYVPVDQSVLYECPASQRALITGMWFYNGNATAQTIFVLRRRSGELNARVFKTTSNSTLAQHETWLPMSSSDRPWVLAAGDTIEAYTTTNEAVEYGIDGALEPVT